MKHFRKQLALAIAATFVAALSFGAQQTPPAPTKTLPLAVGPALSQVRSHTSPITGRVYRIRLEPKQIDSDAEEAPRVAARSPSIAALSKKSAARKAAGANIAQSEFYDGIDRAAAKLSVANAGVESFSDVSDLIDTLPSKTAMVTHTPRITKDADSGRVVEENRNVRVRCWLYAASRERDNDYHLILGRAPDTTPERYMTMEVSGLPSGDASSFDQLFAARKSFNDFFGSNLPESSYSFFDPPIPVIVDGSLFFDIIHERGTPPGPVSLRPNMPVIWEVHPVTRIEFEPNP
jgi:hypothetical protein